MLRLLALALVLTGCADRPSAPDAAPTATDSTSPAPASVRPGVSLDRLLADRADDAPLLAELRAPRRQSARAVANRHVEGQVDSVVTRVYDGLVLEAYVVTGGRTFIRRVDVDEASYGTSDGVSVGESRADLEEVLGVPTREDGETVTYIAGSGPVPTPVEVTYAQGTDGAQRATRVVWHLYVD